MDMEFKIMSSLKGIEDTLLYFKNSLFNKNIDITVLSRKYHECGIVLVMYKNEEPKPIGFVAFYANDIQSRKGFISVICIHKNNQHCGYGSILLHEVIEHMKANSLLYVLLEVNRENRSAIDFYKKHNFEIFETFKNSYILHKRIE